MSAKATNKARLAALFARVQALPRDLNDERGAVLAHLFGAFEAMAEGWQGCTLGRVIDALERAVVMAEASVARRPAA